MRSTRLPVDMDKAVRKLEKQQGHSFSQLSRAALIQCWMDHFVSELGMERVMEIVKTTYSSEDDDK
jgi:hypothetical protein